MSVCVFVLPSNCLYVCPSCYLSQGMSGCLYVCSAVCSRECLYCVTRWRTVGTQIPRRVSPRSVSPSALRLYLALPLVVILSQTLPLDATLSQVLPLDATLSQALPLDATLSPGLSHWSPFFYRKIPLAARPTSTPLTDDLVDVWEREMGGEGGRCLSGGGR